jgi:hypothetical protein
MILTLPKEGKKIIDKNPFQNYLEEKLRLRDARRKYFWGE